MARNKKNASEKKDLIEETPNEPENNIDVTLSSVAAVSNYSLSYETGVDLSYEKNDSLKLEYDSLKLDYEKMQQERDDARQSLMQAQESLSALEIKIKDQKKIILLQNAQIELLKNEIEQAKTSINKTTKNKNAKLYQKQQ